MAYSREDIQAITDLAQWMQVEPGSLAGLFEKEASGKANIWGGAGGQYYGLIQMGPGARKEVGLPSGSLTAAQQMPYIKRYFQQRGFVPGKHGVTEMYRTVLVGNPGQSGTDSFGTNSDSAAKRMMPGGDLYKRATAKLGGASALPAVAASSGPELSSVTPAAASSAPAPAPENIAALTAIAGLEQQLDTGVPGAAKPAALPSLAGSAIAAAIGIPEASKQVVQAAVSGDGSGLGAQGAERMQQLGFKPIEYLTGDPEHGGYRKDHGGGNYHEHLAFSTKAERDAAMAKLKAAGIQIGSINDGVHSKNSLHYRDLAFDVPAAQVPVGKEQELSRRVRRILGIA